jgi:hypothetical protein
MSKKYSGATWSQQTLSSLHHNTQPEHLPGDPDQWASYTFVTNSTQEIAAKLRAIEELHGVVTQRCCKISGYFPGQCHLFNKEMHGYRAGKVAYDAGTTLLSNQVDITDLDHPATITIYFVA